MARCVAASRRSRIGWNSISACANRRAASDASSGSNSPRRTFFQRILAHSAASKSGAISWCCLSLRASFVPVPATTRFDRDAGVDDKQAQRSSRPSRSSNSAGVWWRAGVVRARQLSRKMRRKLVWDSLASAWRRMARTSASAEWRNRARRRRGRARGRRRQRVDHEIGAEAGSKLSAGAGRAVASARRRARDSRAAPPGRRAAKPRPDSPGRASSRAATKPSPPLPPGPQRIAMRAARSAPGRPPPRRPPPRRAPSARCPAFRRRSPAGRRGPFRRGSAAQGDGAGPACPEHGVAPIRAQRPAGPSAPPTPHLALFIAAFRAICAHAPA